MAGISISSWDLVFAPLSTIFLQKMQRPRNVANKGNNSTIVTRAKAPNALNQETVSLRTYELAELCISTKERVIVMLERALEKKGVKVVYIGNELLNWN